jgi:hypothetical protein
VAQRAASAFQRGQQAVDCGIVPSILNQPTSACGRGAVAAERRADVARYIALCLAKATYGVRRVCARNSATGKAKAAAVAMVTRSHRRCAVLRLGARSPDHSGRASIAGW